MIALITSSGSWLRAEGILHFFCVVHEVLLHGNVTWAITVQTKKKKERLDESLEKKRLDGYPILYYKAGFLL